MKNANLVFGLILLLVFLATGVYLKTIFKPEHLADLAMRMEIRANHVYILFIALLNILSVDSYPESTQKVIRFTTVASRTFLFAAGILAVVAFFTEHSGQLTGRLYTLCSAVGSLIGVGLFLISRTVARFK
ncbi:MAG: hypothetical protein JNM27_02350 [Leptospirales bacterium]|nr:hypothetical protein [Leptospirales bacterium]